MVTSLMEHERKLAKPTFSATYKVATLYIAESAQDRACEDVLVAAVYITMLT